MTAIASWSSRELCEAAGIGPRTLARWVAAGVITAATFRGPATRYDARQMAQARAVRALLSQGKTLAAIARVTSKASLDELHRIAPPPAPPAAPQPPPSHDAIPGMQRQRVVELLPGLSLVLRDDATTFVTSVAAEIVARYSTRPVDG